MHRSIVISVLAGALVGGELIRTLRTGKARGRWGTITKQGRPDRYWRYVYSGYVALALCAAAAIWATVSSS
jgi:hypothetical protein